MSCRVQWWGTEQARRSGIASIRSYLLDANTCASAGETSSSFYSGSFSSSSSSSVSQQDSVARNLRKSTTFPSQILSSAQIPYLSYYNICQHNFTLLMIFPQPLPPSPHLLPNLHRRPNLLRHRPRRLRHRLPRHRPHLRRLHAPLRRRLRLLEPQRQSFMRAENPSCTL
jgi:hypothetical protein